MDTTREKVGLLALALGVALIVVDMSVVNLVLPQIDHDLHMGFTGLQYTSVLFALASAAVVIGAGDLADRIGSRRAYLGGLTLFTAASGLAAVSPDETTMLVARALQGVGGGVTMTAALGTINATWTGRARGAAFGLYGVTFAVAGAAGPLIGGALAELADWRVAFGLNLVLGPVAYAGVRALIPAGEARRDARRPDLLGIGLVSAAMTTATLALVQGETYGWITAKRPLDVLGLSFSAGGVSPTVALLGATAVLAAVFGVAQRRRIGAGAPVILDRDLFRSPSFSIGNLALLIVGIGEFGLLFLVPLELQLGRGMTIVEAGLVTLPASLGAMVSFPVVQKLVAAGRARTAVIGGVGLEALGLALVAVAVQSSTVAWMIPAFLVYGFGIGGAAAQISAITLADVPAGRSSLAGGITSANRSLGGSLGVAVLGIAFTVGHGGGALAGVAPGALSDGITAAAGVAVTALLIGLVAVARMPIASGSGWASAEPEGATAAA